VRTRSARSSVHWRPRSCSSSPSAAAKRSNSRSCSRPARACACCSRAAFHCSTRAGSAWPRCSA
jgi:hypothetical protein